VIVKKEITKKRDNW